jgi:phosphodiesterase/alkaline phosphatase D-like protein
MSFEPFQALRRRATRLFRRDETAFPAGVMSGDASSTSAVVWTRYQGRQPLTLTVTEKASGAQLYRGTVRPGDDGYVHVKLNGLQPGTDHRYVFQAGAERRVGAFQTAPAPDSDQVVTFGATSCTNLKGAPFDTLKDAATRDLDFFVYGGDNVYCDGAVTRNGYRRKYQAAWSEEGMADAHAAFGAYATWDDHEVFNNWNPELVPKFWRQAALGAFYEHMPLGPSKAAPGRLWRNTRWGQAAELFILDTRSERKPSTRKGPDAQYLSPEQLAWLKEGLRSSDAVFKFVVNSVPIGEFPGKRGKGASDRWEGYAAQRRELLDFIHENGLTGVWFLSGDFHVGAAGRVGPKGTPDFDLPEVLVGPGAAKKKSKGEPTSSDQHEFMTAQNSYTVFRADPVSKTLDVTFIGEDGQPLFQRRYDQHGEPVEVDTP